MRTMCQHDDVTSPKPRLRPSVGSFAARLGRAVVLLVLFLGIPVGLTFWLVGKDEAIAAGLGSVIVLGSSMLNGRRATRYAAPVTAVAVVLGALTKPVLGHAAEAPAGGWLWVAVVVMFALLAARATEWGAGVALSTATLYAVVAPPFHDLAHLALVVAFLMLGGAYGWLLAGRLGAPVASQAPPTTRRQARLIALFLGIAVGIACSIVVIVEMPHSFWIVTAVVVLGVPTPGLTERAIALRMLGQLGACAIVGLVSWGIEALGPAHAIPLYAAATLVAALAYLMSLGRPLPEQIAFLSAAIMMPTAAKESDHLAGLVSDRLLYNLIGLGILALALLAVRIWAAETETSRDAPPSSPSPA